jgi:hypothetical protein
MAREARSLYPEIVFPINFKEIGLDYELNSDNFDTLTTISGINYLQSHCQDARYDNIQCKVNAESRKPELKVGGILQLRNGTRYEIHSTIASGSFGTTAIVINSVDGKRYCLKRQIARDDDDELDCFKEAMMHHILDINTRTHRKYESDLIPTLYHVIRSVGDEVCIYFIMDLMSTSLLKRLDSIDTYHGRLLEFKTCLEHITPTLNLLYMKGLYNHGDLHMGNVMYYALMTPDGRIVESGYKLIDYGFSRIRIGGGGTKGRILVLNRRNGRSDASRDLTQLITAFELSHRMTEVQFTEGSFENEAQKILKSVLHGKCVGVCGSSHTNDFVGNGWSESYRYFNTHTNTAGTHNEVQRLINTLPDPDKVSASAIRTPRPSRSAPLTPRPSRAAASAAVRQINQQNPGCMLLLLLMMLLAMRGAVWLYHGQGGRDPTMNSLLNNSYQPVIPSKHNLSIYPNMSFQPIHSMQIKSYRKNNSSKTRTNRSASKKNNTRRRSHKIPYAKIEDFDKLSLASFYHYLRFQAFPGISQKEKKEMLREAAMVPLQHPGVFKQIVEAVKENDFYNMMAILKENQLDLEKLGMEIEPYYELWNAILDAYFKEKDSPFELLQTLLHVGGNVEDFLKRYHSADKETKKMMVMQTCITASDFPELILE